MQIATDKPAYSVAETMVLLGLSRQTIYSLINTGQLMTYTVGRRRFVSSKAVSDFINRREVVTNTPGVAGG